MRVATDNRVVSLLNFSPLKLSRQQPSRFGIQSENQYARRCPIKPMNSEDSLAKLPAQRSDNVLSLGRRNKTSMHKQVRRLVYRNAVLIQMQNLKFIYHVAGILSCRV